MAIEITKTTKALSKRTNLQQQIILKIDGFTDCFGAVDVKVIPKYDTGLFYDAPGLSYDGLITANESLDYISLEGTTTQISSQVNIEDGLPNAISRFSVNLIDKNSLLSEKFRPGNIVDDMLGREAQIYISFQGGAFPEDATRIFIGIIDDISFPAGLVKLSISSPEKFRQNEIFIKYNNALNGLINSSVTTVVVDSTTNFIPPVDILQSYIRIGDELLEVTAVPGATSFTVIRGSLGTTAVSHSDNDEIESFYRLTGNPISMALKLMLSNSEATYIDSLSVSAFNQLTPSLFIQNSILFPGINNIEDEYGITEGDTLTITGADNPSNDVIDAVISGFGVTDSGSYILVTSTLVTDTGNTALASFKSQYNTLPVSGGAVAGFGIKPKFIDVKQFQSIASTNSSFFVDYDLLVKDTVAGEDFISSKILFPSGILSIIRKGRTSAVFLAPPVVTNLAPVLNASNIERPESIVLKRSINDHFYNAIVYKFNPDVLEDKFLGGEITQSSDSTNRIKVPNKVLTIEAPGLKDTVANRALIQSISERLLQRYRFGAESMEVFVNYRDSFNLDLRDAVVFDGTNLNIANTENGTRNFEPKVMQIFNRQMNLKTGEVKLLLVNSIYNVDGRYIVIAPASDTATGATTTNIPLKRSYSTSLLDEENEKWQRLIGERVRVRSKDFIYNEETTFIGFRDDQVNTMIVDTLSLAPGVDYIVEPSDYDESSSSINSLTKSIHGSFNRQLTVLAGISSTVFTVVDPSELLEEMVIRIHSEDFTKDSGEVEIIDITGTSITVEDMGFTPTGTDLIDRIGYTDNGDPYLYL